MAGHPGRRGRSAAQYDLATNGLGYACGRPPLKLLPIIAIGVAHATLRSQEVLRLEWTRTNDVLGVGKGVLVRCLLVGVHCHLGLHLLPFSEAVPGMPRLSRVNTFYRKIRRASTGPDGLPGYSAGDNGLVSKPATPAKPRGTSAGRSRRSSTWPTGSPAPSSTPSAARRERLVLLPSRLPGGRHRRSGGRHYFRLRPNAPDTEHAGCSSPGLAGIANRRAGCRAVGGQEWRKKNPDEHPASRSPTRAGTEKRPGLPCQSLPSVTSFGHDSIWVATASNNPVSADNGRSCSLSSGS